MKWCCSRYTTGVTLGTIYIVGSLIVFLFGVVSFIESDNVQNPQSREFLKTEAVQTMIIYGVAAVISSLFIVAIVKRIHYLILLWLLLGIYVFYVTCKTIYLMFIGAGLGLASGVMFLILFLISVLSLAIEITIFCFSWSMFKEIRNENIEKLKRFEQQMTAKTLI